MNDRQTLLEVLFPGVRAAILRKLFAHRGEQFHVRELARHCGLALSTVQQELHRLGAIGVVSSFRRGKYKLYRADRTHSLAEHLSRIVQISERTSTIPSSSLRRPRLGGKRKARSRVRPPTMRPDRQPNWGLFRNR